MKTDDPAFAPAQGSNLLAEGGAKSAAAGDTLTQSQIDGDPRLGSFGDMRIAFADLAGDALGYARAARWIS